MLSKLTLLGIEFLEACKPLEYISVIQGCFEKGESAAQSSEAVVVEHPLPNASSCWYIRLRHWPTKGIIKRVQSLDGGVSIISERKRSFSVSQKVARHIASVYHQKLRMLQRILTNRMATVLSLICAIG